MKAAQYNKYGDHSVLAINQNAPFPDLKQDQILVENYASSINPFDISLRSGFLQKKIPLTFPLTIGGDFAGVVKEVSYGVDDFKIGDRVYGQALGFAGGSGSIAEYVAANVKNTAIKPENANFLESAALPLVGASVVQALVDDFKLQKGQKILIHGGSGGIGHIAIQLAKSIGAYVATTVNGADIEFVKNLGADQAIDYKTENFAEILEDFTLVFDLVGGKVTDESFKVLKKGGTIISMKGLPDSKLSQKFAVRAVGQSTSTTAARLNKLKELVDNFKIKVYLDKVFPLEQAREAFEYIEENHTRGKVVLKIK